MRARSIAVFLAPLAASAIYAFARAATAPRPASIDAAAIPSTSSSAPNDAEWGAAKPIAMRWMRGCTAKLLREWVHVWCPGKPVRSAIVAGDHGGIAFGQSTFEATGAEGIKQALGNGATLTFPLRRGERRVVQLWLKDQSWDDDKGATKTLHGEVRVVSAYWLEGDARPVITIQ